MKEERKIKSSNETIQFMIENTKFVYSTFYDKSSFFTFIHKVDDNAKINEHSPLLVQFETHSQADYLNLKRSFGKLINNFSTTIKNKTKIEHQLVELIKSDMKCDTVWYNPAYNYVPPAPQYKNNNISGSSNNKKVSGYQQCGHIKPVIVLETLQSMGEIIVDNVTHNTSGEQFWNYRIANDLSKAFKTSVKTKAHLFSDPANLYNSLNEIFNDVKQSSKGYGKGSIGLIRFLGDNGLFPNPLFGNENKDESVKRSVDYILANIYPKVDSQYLANNQDLANQYKAVDGIKIMNYPRLPFKNNSKIDVIKNYLTNERRLSNKLVSRMINEGLLYGGSFATNAMGDSELKFFRDQYFFNLTNQEGNSTGSEKLFLETKKDYKTGQNSLKINKRNTHPVKGNGFRLLSKSNNPSGTFIAEAVIDVCSAYELFSIAGLDPESFNYISIQGCGNLNNFCAINAGFGFETNEQYRPNGEFFGVKIKETKEKISPAKIEHYNNNFNKNDYYFINTMNEKCQEIINKIPSASKVLGKEIKIVNKKARDEYIDYNSYDRKTTVFLDETSFDEFFNINKISFEYDSETKKYKTMVTQDKEEFIPINQEIKNKIYSLMMKNFKTTTLMFGLDFDEAGLKYRKTLNNLGDTLNIKVYDMYPDIIDSDSKDPKIDVNDILKKYYKLKDSNKEDEALLVVENYVKKLVPNLNILKKNRTVNNKP